MLSAVNASGGQCTNAGNRNALPVEQHKGVIRPHTRTERLRLYCPVGKRGPGRAGHTRLCRLERPARSPKWDTLSSMLVSDAIATSPANS